MLYRRGAGIAFLSVPGSKESDIPTTAYGEEQQGCGREASPLYGGHVMSDNWEVVGSALLFSSFRVCCPGEVQSLLSPVLQVGGAGISLLKSGTSRQLSQMPARGGKGW